MANGKLLDLNVELLEKYRKDKPDDLTIWFDENREGLDTDTVIGVAVEFASRVMFDLQKLRTEVEEMQKDGS